MQTSEGRITRISRAHVAVIAIRCRTARARSTRARIIGSARISIAARIIVVAVYAAGHIVARVGRAHIAVVAIRRRTANARTARAGVIGGASISIGARTGVVGVLTAVDRVTRVIRANVAIAAT